MKKIIITIQDWICKENVKYQLQSKGIEIFEVTEVKMEEKIHYLDEELREQLKEEILERYDNEEYWNPDIIRWYEQEKEAEKQHQLKQKSLNICKYEKEKNKLEE